MKTYEIITIETDKYTAFAIRCLQCNMVSYNPNDIKHKYCGKCKQFHLDNINL